MLKWGSCESYGMINIYNPGQSSWILDSGMHVQIISYHTHILNPSRARMAGSLLVNVGNASWPAVRCGAASDLVHDFFCWVLHYLPLDTCVTPLDIRQVVSPCQDPVKTFRILVVAQLEESERVGTGSVPLFSSFLFLFLFLYFLFFFFSPDSPVLIYKLLGWPLLWIIH